MHGTDLTYGQMKSAYGCELKNSTQPIDCAKSYKPIRCLGIALSLGEQVCILRFVI